MMKLLLLCCLSVMIGLPFLYGQNQKASTQVTTSGSFIPAGVIMPYAGATAPSGWVFAYGQEVSQTSATYKTLYVSISTTYCTTDHGGTCTEGNFRLPDLRGRFLGGKDNMGGTAATRITSAKTMDGTILGKGNGNLAEQVTQGTHSDIDIAHGHGFTQPSAHSDIDIAHGHGFTQPSAHSDIDIAHGHGFTQPSMPAHYHTFGTNTSMSAAGHTLGTTYVNLRSFDGAPFSSSAGTTCGGTPNGVYGNSAGCYPASQAADTVDLSHSHLASAVSGCVGGSATGACTGGINGNSAQADSGGSVTALGATTKSISAHAGASVTVLGAANKPISAHAGASVTALGATNKSISAHAAINNLPPTVIINYIIKL